MSGSISTSKPKLPSEFAPESRLEELIATYGRSPDGDSAFYRELLNSEVVTLGRLASSANAKEGYHRLESDMEFRIQLLAWQGEPIVAIYTSTKRMMVVIPEEYYHGTGYFQMNCRTMLSSTMPWGPKTRYALNPGHMMVKTLSYDEVKVMLDGTIFKQIEDARARMGVSMLHPHSYPKGADIRITRPAAIPPLLIERLTRHFKSTGDVERAYLGDIFVASLGQPDHLLLCIAPKNKDWNFEKVCSGLHPIIRSVLGDRGASRHY